MTQFLIFIRESVGVHYKPYSAVEAKTPKEALEKAHPGFKNRWYNFDIESGRDALVGLQSPITPSPQYIVVPVRNIHSVYVRSR